jgi:hypothetical protein
MNPAVNEWIKQLAHTDQVVAYYAYQCLEEEVFHASGPKDAETRADLVKALGEALVAQQAPAAGSQAAPRPLYPARARNSLARLLSYLPGPEAVPNLAQALQDLEVREMARFALESNASEQATEALLAALNSLGPVFLTGVVSSLAQRRGEKVLAALRKAAEDPQIEVRLAALGALADFPEPSHDALLEKSTRAESAEERRRAHLARARLAETLQASGSKAAAERVYRAILASGAPEPQKKAARLALGGAAL